MFASSESGLHWRALQFALIAAAHVAAIAWLWHAQFRVDPEAELVRMTVRTVEQTPPPKPKVEPPRSVPPPPQQKLRAAPPPEPVEPPPVLTAEPSADAAPATFTVPPQPPPREEPPPPPPIVAATVTAPRFDAAYLQNPAPSYPLLSRRLGEAGKVLLRVQVTAHGTAERVQVAQSCGFSRLDEAAVEAVRKWRFVPARRGEEAVAAEVLVPIVFRLDR
jgi:protein TonB